MFHNKVKIYKLSHPWHWSTESWYCCYIAVVCQLGTSYLLIWSVWAPCHWCFQISQPLAEIKLWSLSLSLYLCSIYCSALSLSLAVSVSLCLGMSLFLMIGLSLLFSLFVSFRLSVFRSLLLLLSLLISHSLFLIISLIQITLSFCLYFSHLASLCI